MQSEKALNKTELLRLIPSVNALIQGETAQNLLDEIGANRLSDLARIVTNSLREEILESLKEDDFNFDSITRETLLEKAEASLETLWEKERSASLKKVINATGVAIHTNLGRAPLSGEAQEAMIKEASRYCTLEYDIETGERGKRGLRVEQLLSGLTGAEAALVVNNCAAAAILVLTALCKGGEAIVSRGELVEIGGDFRVPDLMKETGAHLVEVGTTNKTRVADYENAITENTKLITKVHTSNYRIVGFTSAPSISELSQVSKQNGVLLFEDAGSGALLDLSEFGLHDEPIIAESIAAGADVVTFSGDKLLGGTQAGMIVGRADVIAKIRKHPFYRALRTSKLIYAALEKTLEAFRRETAMKDIPILKMISLTEEELRKKSEDFAEQVRASLGKQTKLTIEIENGKSVIGGGSAPSVQPNTTLLSIRHLELSVNGLEKKLRSSRPAVIGRVLDEKVLLDLRTVSEKEESELAEILVELAS